MIQHLQPLLRSLKTHLKGRIANLHHSTRGATHARNINPHASSTVAGGETIKPFCLCEVPLNSVSLLVSNPKIQLSLLVPNGRTLGE